MKEGFVMVLNRLSRSFSLFVILAFSIGTSAKLVAKSPKLLILNPEGIASVDHGNSAFLVLCVEKISEYQRNIQKNSINRLAYISEVHYLEPGQDPIALDNSSGGVTAVFCKKPEVALTP